VLIRKINQTLSAPSDNPTNHEMLSSKTPPTAIHFHCSWWVFGLSTLQLVGYWNKHFAAGRFSEQAQRSWRVFIWRGRLSWFCFFQALIIGEPVAVGLVDSSSQATTAVMSQIPPPPFCSTVVRLIALQIVAIGVSSEAWEGKGHARLQHPLR